MKAIVSFEPAATPLRATTQMQRGGGLGARLILLGRAARHAYLQVFGIPDYERYAAHMAIHHQGETLLSRREFFARAIDRKYCRNGPRCC